MDWAHAIHEVWRDTLIPTRIIHTHVVVYSTARETPDKGRSTAHSTQTTQSPVPGSKMLRRTNENTPATELPPHRHRALYSVWMAVMAVGILDLLGRGG